MVLRLAALFLLLSSVACAASSQPPPALSCAELVDHAALLRVESRLAQIPESEHEAHREALTRALAAPLRVACDRMTASERTCWRDATSTGELSRCVLPTANDVDALARAGRTLIDDAAGDDAPALPLELDLTHQVP